MEFSMKQIFFVLLLITTSKSFAADCNTDVRTALINYYKFGESIIPVLEAEHGKPNPDQEVLKGLEKQIAGQFLKFCEVYKKSYTPQDSCTVQDDFNPDRPIVLAGKEVYKACDNAMTETAGN